MSTVLAYRAVRTGRKEIIAVQTSGDETVARKVVGTVNRQVSRARWVARLDCRCGHPIFIGGGTLNETRNAVERHLAECGRWWS